MTTVDNRVVQMGFDNQQFERGVTQSISSLANLKKGLELNESAKSLTNLGTVAKGFSIANIGEGVQNISSKFSIMGAIGFTAIQNITNAVIDLGKRLVTVALGIDNIKGGFSEYEQGLSAFQTILANTKSAGATIQDVNKAMADLNVYANQTVYSYGDMTKAAGLFTAQGVNLKDSITGIKGIFNIVSLTGGSADKANSAIYQLSQAIASGTVRAQDWISVVNAGIGGTDFQNQLIQTARVHGVSVDAMIKKEGSFKASLQAGWLSSKILLETLSQYTGDLDTSQLKSLGYTEEQIAQIQDLGKTANDSATKLKSMSQVLEMFKSNLVTSWAQSFKIVIGNLDEAYDLWSYIGNTVGGILQGSSDARNALLQKWKDLGGRTVLVSSLKMAFQGVLNVIQQVKAAFTAIFPPTTAVDLYNITQALYQFSKKLVLGGEGADKLQRILKGVFAILDIARMLIVALASAFFKLTGSMAPTGNSIIDFLVKIGDYLVKLREGIKINDTFGKAITRFGAWLTIAKKNVTDFVNEFVKRFNEIKDKITPTFNKIKETITNFINEAGTLFDKIKYQVRKSFDSVDTGGVSSFFDKIGGRFAPFLKLFGGFASLLSGIGHIISGLSPMFFKLAGGVATALGKLANSIGDGLTKIDVSALLTKLGIAIRNGIANLDFSKTFDTINVGLLGALILAFRNFINKGSGAVDGVKGVIDNFGGILKGVTGILNGVQGSLKIWQETLKAKILMTIAIAIGILTLSLIALSMIDSQKLTMALLALTTMFADLMGSMALYSKAGGGVGGEKLAISLVALSVALLIMSVAISKLAKIDPKTINQALLSMGALIGELLGFTKLLSKETGNIIKGAAGLIIFGLALEIFVDVVRKLGSIDTKTLTQGLIGVGALLAELALFMKVSNFDNMGVSKGIGIIALAGAVLILSLSVEKFAKMDANALKQGLVAVGAVLSELAIFVKLTGDSKGVIATAVGMTILSGAMFVFALVIEKMGNMSWEQIGKGLTTMGASLAIIAVSMKLLPKDMLVTGIALAIVAGALLLVSTSLANMAELSWEQISKGLVGLAGALAIIAVAMGAMEGTILGAAALVVVAAALMLIVPVLKSLGSMDIKQVGIGLLALAGVFGVLALAGYLLTPVIPTLLGLAAALVLVGIATVAVGVGVLAFSAGLTALAASGAVGAAAITLLVSTFLGLLPAIATSLVNTLVLFAQLIAEAAPAIGQAFTTILLQLISIIATVTPPLLEALTALLLNLIQVIVTVVPAFVNAILYLVNQLLISLAAALPQFIQSGMDIITSILTGIANNIGGIVTQAINIVTNFIDAVAKKLPDIIESGIQLILSFLNGLSQGIDQHSAEINAAVANLAKAIIKGLSDGIAGGVDDIVKAIGKIAGGAITALKTLLGIMSPSKVFRNLGELTTQGFVNGIIRFGYKAEDAASNVGSRALAGISNAIGQISDAVNTNLDMAPTIRPVVDLTDVISSGKEVDKLLNTGLNLSPTTSKLLAISTGIGVSNGVGLPANQIGAQGSNISLVQNNYSPTALSRLEIYRQTRNQLTTLKGLVQNK